MVNKFNIGDRAAISYNGEFTSSYLKGKIVAFSSRNPNEVAVEIDNGSMQTFSLDFLYDEMEAALALEQSQHDKMKLEEQFLSVQEFIRKKLSDANELIQAANELALSYGKSLQGDFFNEANDIAATIGAEWDSSSNNC